MNKKKTVGILFGGQSVNREVCWQSVRDVVGAIDRTKYRPILIGIDKTGEWRLYDSIDAQNKGPLTLLTATDFNDNIDVIFPIPHALLSQDGAVQGLLNLSTIPFVGSAVTLDKAVMKRKLREANIPTAAFIVLQANEVLPIYQIVAASLGTEFVVKSAKTGSTVGPVKVTNAEQYEQATTAVFSHDDQLLIEQYIQSRTLECAVLGNRHPTASVPGETLSNNKLFSNHAHFTNEKGTAVQIPAKVSLKLKNKMQQLAIKACQALSCKGVATVDFLLTSNNDIVVNKINIIPDFTTSSAYPGLWQASGICYSALINRLLLLALERFDGQKQPARLCEVN
ncbi:MAG: D-alanine--D-alanine ligase [Algicola sp.]|nr:D-alanine--D-alanine ligase [Algicola sp.]